MNQILASAFHGLFLYLGLALLLAVLVGMLRSPRVKGWLGERAVPGDLLQRGPLAGQVFLKCGNTQGCGFVRPPKASPQRV